MLNKGCPELPNPPGSGSTLTCWQNANHEGLHTWEYCEANTGEPSACEHDCDKKIGHDGQHHATIEW